MSASKISFTRFEVQQCIQYSWPDEEPTVMPIHPKQDKSVLDSLDDDYFDHTQFNLVAVRDPNLDTYCIIEQGEGPFTKMASSSDNKCYLLTGCVDRIFQRVVGFEEGFLTPISMGEHESAGMAHSVCEALSSMLSQAKANGKASTMDQA